MKRGRPAFTLSALARPDDERAVAEAMLRETSTLGVRIAHLDRIELDRESFTVEVAGEPVRVKVGRLDGEIVNLAPEHADCERAARITGEPVKVVWAKALAAAMPRTHDDTSRSTASRELGSVVVAFSGGVDSSRRRRDRLPRARRQGAGRHRRVPAVATGELDGARRVAAHIGIAPRDRQHRTSSRAPATAPTAADRCYFCKSELYDVLAELATHRGYNALLSGANQDDQGDWRPGLKAAAEHGVVHPLQRHRPRPRSARSRAPSTSPAPRSPPRPAWRSRIPYGTAVDPETLALIDRAERNVSALGFPVLRVRHHGIMGRLEVDDQRPRPRARARARRSSRRSRPPATATR